MNKEADALDYLYSKLNKQQLLKQIQKDPIAFSRTRKGKLLYNLLSMIPSQHQVDDYRKPYNKQPIKIVFTGMGDGSSSKHSIKHFENKFKDSKNIFFFGWPQYREAMIFASRLDPNTPVEVYGHSWGSNAARKFIQNYQGNIIKGHFFDPMRRDVAGQPVLDISRNIPITYTPITKQDRNISTVLHGALRWKPSQRMIITQPASKHDAVAQWLSILDNQKEVKKVANFLFKYGSYTQTLRATTIINTNNKQ